MQQEQRNRVKVAEPASNTASGRIVSSRRLDLASNVATRTAAIDEQRTNHKLYLRTFYTNHHSVAVKAASDGPRSRINLKPNQSFNLSRNVHNGSRKSSKLKTNTDKLIGTMAYRSFFSRFSLGFSKSFLKERPRIFRLVFLAKYS